MSADEVLIAFSAAARTLPHPVHPTTLHRWADIGLGGVKLQSRWQGRRRYTTAEWLATFVAECESRRYLQDQLNRESFERALAVKFGLTKPRAEVEGDRDE